jgi:hypothetical protein
MRVVTLTVSLVLGVLVSGCSIFSDPYGVNGTKITTLRPRHPGTKTVAIEFPRTEYEKALDSGSKNEIRLIEVFSKDRAANAAPEYRFFGIEKGSVYDLMGLQSLDVLVAASDYVIPSSDLFWQYLQLLRNHETGSIEIRRDGVPMVFNYTIVGAGLTPAERTASAPGRSKLETGEQGTGGRTDGQANALERRLEEELHDELS